MDYVELAGLLVHRLEDYRSGTGSVRPLEPDTVQILLSRLYQTLTPVEEDWLVSFLGFVPDGKEYVLELPPPPETDAGSDASHRLVFKAQVPRDFSVFRLKYTSSDAETVFLRAESQADVLDAIRLLSGRDPLDGKIEELARCIPKPVKG